MGILQNLWLLITFSISAIILITDPKEPIASSGTNPVSGLFSSSSKGQKFIYWGPLKPLEKILLRSKISPWAFFASDLYHNKYWLIL